MVTIKSIAPRSPADKAGIKPGSRLVSVNGYEINDVLDYMYHGDDDIGLEFDTYLMDEKRSCNNNCIFCFIDQLPPNLRDTLYFKDDDSRLSFLQGNYITLNNLTERDISRICEMKTPVNISVHTTNPELRCRMMRNPVGGERLSCLKRFSDAGVRMNCQLVLCPQINDGNELTKSLSDLAKLEMVESVACVPVGLTKYYRKQSCVNGKGFCKPVRNFMKDEAIKVVRSCEQFKNAFASDEFYLLAKLPFPPYKYYGDFAQYENGVGMCAKLKKEFDDCVKGRSFGNTKPKITIATGRAVEPFLTELTRPFSGRVTVRAIHNNFFGGGVSVSGLVTGMDIINQLVNKVYDGYLFIPENMLNVDGLFIDGLTVRDIESVIDARVRVIPLDGAKLYHAIMESK